MNITFEKLPIPHFSDMKQKLAFNNILRFIALMLVFTLVARGTEGATLAKVSIINPYAGEIVETESTTAKIEATINYVPLTPQGITINQIVVVPGQSVKVGDTLIILNKEEIEELKQRTKIKLENINLKLSKLERKTTNNSSALIAAQNARDWAKHDVASAKENGQRSIDSANELMRTAEQRVAEAQAYYEQLLANSASEQEKKDALLKIDNATANVEATRVILADATANNIFSQNTTGRALEIAEQSLLAAEKADLENQQIANDLNAQNSIDSKMMKLEIESENKILNCINSIGEKGEVFSTVEGMVLEIDLASSKTNDKAPVTISDKSGGFRAIGTFSKEISTRLNVGLSADILINTGYFETQKLGTATLTALQSTENNNDVTAIFQLPDGEWKQGDMIDLELLLKRENHPICIPSSAIRMDRNGYFVLLVEQNSNVLGTENIVQAVPVKIISKDKSGVAVSGEISSESCLIVKTSKPITKGDKVRIQT